MRRFSIMILFLAVAFMLSLTDSRACTNVLVTKGASADGSNMISYAADSHQLSENCIIGPHKAGSWGRC